MTKKILFLLPAMVLWQTVICARICPYTLLPKDWVQSYQEGKEWTKLLLRFYAASFSEPKNESDSKASDPVPVITTAAHNFSMVEHIDPCPEIVVTMPRLHYEVRVIRKST